MGSGVGRRAAVHWGVAGQMATGWIFTIPMAGVVGRHRVVDRGPLRQTARQRAAIVIAVILVAAAGSIFYLASKRPITAEELDRTTESTKSSPPPKAPSPAPAAA